MKYIRTKDENNLIIDMTNMLLPYNLTNEFIDFNKFGMFKIIKQADTIEELCDKFVITEHGTDDNFIMEDFEDVKAFFIGDSVVFGAIWTNKGLIFVARMNNEGALELL